MVLVTTEAAGYEASSSVLQYSVRRQPGKELAPTFSKVCDFITDIDELGEEAVES